MSQIIVELTGDEKRLLDAFRKSEAADKSLRDSLKKTGEEGSKAGDSLADRWIKAGKQTEGAFKDPLKELRQFGPEGRKVIQGIESHFRETGKAGRRSMEEIIDGIRQTDPEAADAADKVLQHMSETADKIKAEMDAADQQVKFDSTLAELDKLVPGSAAAARKVTENLEEADRRIKLKETLGEIDRIDPATAEAARKFIENMEEADRKTMFNNSLDEIEKLVPGAGRAAREVVHAMDDADRKVKFDRMVAEIAKVDPAAAAAARKAERSFQRSAKKGGDAYNKFGKSAVSQVLSIAGAYVSVERAIAAIVHANRKVLDTNKEILEGLKGTQSGDRRLLQVSEDGADFQQLRQTSDRLFADYGLERNESRNLVFSARSEGFEGALDFIASNRQVVDVEAQARVAGQVPSLFTQQDITPQESINATLAAATSSRLSFEEIGRSLPAAAASAATAGATLEETAATLSVFAGRFKSGEQGADRIAAFASTVNLDERFDGLGLTEAAQRIQALPEEDRREFLGESRELNEAFEVFVEEMSTIAQRTREIRSAVDATGTSQSPIALRRESAQQDPFLAAQLRATIAENRNTLARESKRAIDEADRQTQVSDNLRAAENLGANRFNIAVAETASDVFAGFGAERASADVINIAAPTEIGNLIRDLNNATESGDEQAAPVLSAATRLREARSDDPNALLSRTDISLLLNNATGSFVSPSDITEDIQRTVTGAFSTEAGEAAGFGSSFTSALPAVLGGSAARAFSGEAGSQSADRIIELLERQVSALERQNKIAENQNEIAERNASASETTATNTTPKKPRRDYDRMQADARSGR